MVSDEKADERNTSKAEKKRKLAEKTKSFKDYLEKSVEREVISESSHITLSDKADKNKTKLNCDCLEGKEEPSWTLVMKYDSILFKVSTCMSIGMTWSLLCFVSVNVVFSFYLILYFQAGKLQQNQHKSWLLVNSNLCVYVN